MQPAPQPRRRSRSPRLSSPSASVRQPSPSPSTSPLSTNSPSLPPPILLPSHRDSYSDMYSSPGSSPIQYSFPEQGLPSAQYSCLSRRPQHPSFATHRAHVSDYEDFPRSTWYFGFENNHGLSIFQDPPFAESWRPITYQESRVRLTLL